MSQALQSPGFHVGDKVWVPLAVGEALGTVVEDRGPIGVGGRRLFRVRVNNGPYAPHDHVRPEGELKAIDEATKREMIDKLSPTVIADYLSAGGLLAILQAEPAARVWLMRDSLGGLTHTYEEGFSVTGGRHAPQYALQGEKLFSPKLPEVIEFLKSFGLSNQQSEQVASKVGVAP